MIDNKNIDQQKEYSYKEILFILKKRKKFILLTSMIILAAVIYYTLVIKPVYKSSIVVMVS